MFSEVPLAAPRGLDNRKARAGEGGWSGAAAEAQMTDDLGLDGRGRGVLWEWRGRADSRGGANRTVDGTRAGGGERPRAAPVSGLSE